MLKKSYLSLLVLGSFILAGCNESTPLTQIHAKLTPVKSFHASGINLCTPEHKKNDPFFKPYLLEKYQYSASYSCFNSQCELQITKNRDNNYPSSFSLYLLSKKGVCSLVEVPTKDKISLVYYKSVVEVPRDLYLKLNVEGDTTDVESKKGTYQGYSRDMEHTRLEFTYETLPETDVISVNSIEKIELIF
jgi:hypothetical protein